MKKLLLTLCAAAMAVTAIASSMVEANAAPVLLPKLETGSTGIQQVRDGGERFYRRGNYYYYNGHRGYRHSRPGWREHNGWWFPPAAFIAGALIGGAIASQPAPVYREPEPVYRQPSYGDAHVRWCYERYRSYRSYDNTFQPNYGPRQQCVSPYYR
jgi:hypothetical protein